MTSPSKQEEHKQITAHCGFVLPLDIKNGLPYMPLRPPSTRECQTLPQIVLTRDSHWDPRVLDFSVSESSEWTNPLSNSIPLVQNNPFDKFGDYQRIEVENHLFRTSWRTHKITII